MAPHGPFLEAIPSLAEKAGGWAQAEAACAALPTLVADGQVRLACCRLPLPDVGVLSSLLEVKRAYVVLSQLSILWGQLQWRCAQCGVR